MWQYTADKSENSSHSFNSFETKLMLNENSGQCTKNILPVKNAWKLPFLLIKTT